MQERFQCYKAQNCCGCRNSLRGLLLLRRRSCCCCLLRCGTLLLRRRLLLPKLVLQRSFHLPKHCLPLLHQLAKLLHLVLYQQYLATAVVSTPRHIFLRA